MVTEITTSEISIRILNRIGDLAIAASTYYEEGDEDKVQEVILESTRLRNILQCYNSQYLIWTDFEIKKYMESVAVEFDLVDVLLYGLDWLNTFNAPSTNIIRDGVYIEVPSGTGYMFVENGLITVDPWNPLTVNDLRNG